MTEEMAQANLWATNAMVDALLATRPTEPSLEGREHIRKLRALEHLRDNLARAMEAQGWFEP